MRKINTQYKTTTRNNSNYKTTINYMKYKMAMGNNHIQYKVNINYTKYKMMTKTNSS